MRSCKRCGHEHDCPADYEQYRPTRPPSRSALEAWRRTKNAEANEDGRRRWRGLVFALLSHGIPAKEVGVILKRHPATLHTHVHSVSRRIERSLRFFEARYLGYKSEGYGPTVPGAAEALRGEHRTGYSFDPVDQP